jgi:hypothetical protein
MTFQETIATLADQYLSDRTAETQIKPLLVALGCTHLNANETAVQYQSPNSPPKSAANEELIARTLVRALYTQPMDGTHFPEDGFSLLIGLSANQRWRVCLESLDASYELAVALLSSCIASPSIDAGLVLMSAADNHICALLNDWVSPVKPFRHAPDPLVVARCLFGEAWCSLSLEEFPQPSYSLPHIVRSQRPPFLAGILPARLETAAIGLPTLDMA